MTCFNPDARGFFLIGMRIFFGAWLLYVGLSKWIFIGPGAFVGFITSEFDKTWSPHLLNALLAWLILFAEPLLAAFILSGWKERLAWTLTALLMFLLTIGQTILMKPDVIANWEYLVLTWACAALSGPESRLGNTRPTQD
ncbi:MAG: MauE/DoxX family redox-associated membrane protein [bacterium]